MWNVRFLKGGCLLAARLIKGATGFVLPAGDRRLMAPLLACALLPVAAGATATVEIRRTADGIPHVRAQNWHDLGHGIGYVQAEDALCTLAEGFLTWAGRRSREFGGSGRPAADATFGQPTNRELDFFFRAFVTREALRSYQRGQPASLNALAKGYAAGYNHYLHRARSGVADTTHRACLEHAWVRPITADDVYRRLLAAQWAGGLAHFIPALVGAAHPAGTRAHERSASADVLRRSLRVRVGDDPSLGSNAMAFGEAVTGESQAVLFGNPHWYWSGPDRFYQMHLSIPGRLDVAGAAFLGVPMVMIGFNEQVAWTHTVSMARRFSLYALKLDGSRTPRYRVGKTRHRLRQRTVRIEVRGEDGRIRTERRTFRSSGIGPLIDLSVLDPDLQATADRAFVLRDVNADNSRVFAQFLAWNQARSLEGFIDIQRRMLAMPWVNTVAIGRGDGRVWYADLGAVPAERDDWVQRCVLPGRQASAVMDNIGLPVFDGSRRACLPGGGSSSPAAARLRAAEMPSQLRPDYVANMNNGYWLTSAQAPLTGFPAVMGGEPDELTMRARQGHRLALAEVARPLHSARALADRLAHDLLASGSYSAYRYRAAVVATACDDPGELAVAPVDDDAGLRRACEVLSAWSGEADPGSRGALLWEAVWRAFMQARENGVTGVPSAAPDDVADPLNEALAGEKLLRTEVRAAMLQAVAEMRAEGLSLDAPLEAVRMVSTIDGPVLQFGGCDEHGYFMVFCDHRTEGGGIEGNTYLQLVHFADDGVHARTLLAHGQDEDALTAAVSDFPSADPVVTSAAPGSVTAPLVRYAQRRWLAFPFTEAQIARDGVVSRLVLFRGGAR